MRKETKEMLKKILSNQQLIMDHFKINAVSPKNSAVKNKSSVGASKKTAVKKTKK